MEFFTEDQFTSLANPGVVSTQLLSPHNSTTRRITITRVSVEPGAIQPPHIHASSEQVWIVLEGKGTLLLSEKGRKPIKAGEIVRFEDGNLHGFKNTGTTVFVYMSVTSPPIDFSYAYQDATDSSDAAQAQPHAAQP
ncbi:MAG TPA: cupin domain-containing protein [Paucimonas sp.]|nr:cupin domain-containing protein [Paucimonas sp.]HJW56536.1 cupin domain-containing protein [Burkholderiaceae bacterium]